MGNHNAKLPAGRAVIKAVHELQKALADHYWLEVKTQPAETIICYYQRDENDEQGHMLGKITVDHEMFLEG